MRRRTSVLAATMIASLALVPGAAFAQGGGGGGGGSAVTGGGGGGGGTGGGGGGTSGGGGGGGRTVCFITAFDPVTGTEFVTCASPGPKA
jgi:hypothetical protein